MINGSVIEAVCKSYVKTILFRVLPADRRKLTSKIFSMTKGSNSKECKVNESSIAQVLRDKESLQSFFIASLGQESGLEIIELIENMHTFMTTPSDELLSFTIERMEALPMSAESVRDVLDGVMSLREDCSTKTFVDDIMNSLAPTIRKCNRIAEDSASTGGSIPKIARLYVDCTPEQKNDTSAITSWFVRTASAPVVKKEESEDEMRGGDLEQRESLIGDMMDVLNQHQEDLKQQAMLEAEAVLEEKRAEEERLKLMMNVEGKMEKKSHNVWQKRYFKLSTRYDAENKPVYTLVWYKKKGALIDPIHTVHTVYLQSTFTLNFVLLLLCRRLCS